MYTYTYSRVLNIETGQYNIDYGSGEISLIEEINNEFSGNKACSIICNDTEVAICFEEELTQEQESILDNIVVNHE